MSTYFPTDRETHLVQLNFVNCETNHSNKIVYQLLFFLLFRTNPSYVPSIFPPLDDEDETKPKKPEPKYKRYVKVSARQNEGED